jgi:hypothetical protein
MDCWHTICTQGVKMVQFSHTVVGKLANMCWRKGGRMVQVLKEKPVNEEQDELITLTEAERRYAPKVTRLRLTAYVRRGQLEVKARVHGPGPGGVILVSDLDVRRLIENPPRGHRFGFGEDNPRFRKPD